MKRWNLNHLMKWLLHLLLLLISYSYLPLDAQPSDYPNAHLPATWANNRSLLPEVKFNDGRTMVRPILLRGTTGIAFSCGFFSEGLPDNFLFAILIVQINSSLGIDPHPLYLPKVVWHAETKTPITEDATLQLTVDGDLVLRDIVGNAVWSTNTSEKNVTVLSLTEMGNLVLFDERNASVWQSFDHPTDALLSGQKLVEGQRLTSAFVEGKRVTVTSPVMKNSNSVQFNVSLGVDGLSAFIDFDDHQQLYYKGWPESQYLISGKGSMELVVDLFDLKGGLIYYMRLESDGRLAIQQLGENGREGAIDIIIGGATCSAPAVCGEFGICSYEYCSCPQPDTSAVYFRPINSSDVSQGCFRVTPLDCEKTQYHDFLQIQDVSYFNYMDSDAAVYKGIDENSCKKACMDNCSCQAALFQFGGNLTNGSCFLPSHLFSLENNRENIRGYNSSAFVKVQMPPIAQSPDQLDRSPVSNPTPSRKKIGRTVILGSTLGASLGAFLIIIICVVLWRKRADVEDIEEDSFNHVAGILTKFSYEDLKAGTANFCRQLGAGGFGSVFEGALGDGMKVAVKRLNGIQQGRKDFLAEVETIGTIHHLNLVRLIGFCAEKSYRLLVYEYMCNGSLDKWIYPRNQNPALDWTTRKKIILDIAKGLSYLHEECRERIAHLDIKPGNILLDEDLNAKLSDFGLSKLIDRDLSHVTTTLRGTPGYMAPEWLSSKITAKVDVYSFGIVVLEIVCGRKNLDSSQPEESIHLVSLLKKKAEDNQLFDMVDKQSSDMQCHVEEAVEMIRISIWCLQGDHNRRPSMSMVVKVLEGVMDIEPILGYDFLTPTPIVNHNQTTSRVSSPLVASTLSGPR